MCVSLVPQSYGGTDPLDDQGRLYTMGIDHYESVLKHLADEIVAQSKLEE